MSKTLGQTQGNPFTVGDVYYMGTPEEGYARGDKPAYYWGKKQQSHVFVGRLEGQVVAYACPASSGLVMAMNGDKPSLRGAIFSFVQPLPNQNYDRKRWNPKAWLEAQENPAPSRRCYWD